MDIPELNSSQRAILDLLKHHGSLTVPRLAVALDLNVETVRGHVGGLETMQLVHREGRIADGPGRPEILFTLSAAAERLFPRGEADVLKRLAEHLRRSGNQDLLDDFFDEWIRERREAAMERVRGLEGKQRLEEVATILSELGFMAVVAGADDSADLRLCHCPLRGLVEATTAPCRAEIDLVQELLGRKLTRLTYIPAGDASCSYRVQPEAS